MASGLPIACSRLSSMHEIIKDGCIYFDPLDSKEISSALKELLISPNMREKIANKAYRYSRKFSWELTAGETFNYLNQIRQEKP